MNKTRSSLFQFLSQVHSLLAVDSYSKNTKKCELCCTHSSDFVCSFLSASQMTMQEYNMLQEEEDDEEFLQHYRMQRIEEMRRQLCRGKRFEQVYELNSGEEFLEALDKEDKSTLVMIHIYEPDVPGCEAMSGSLMCLAQEYPLVKFCSVRSSAISTSALFRDSALPALLVYKAGDLIGNFVRLTDQLGEDFFAVDLEALLQEYGLLPEKPPVVPKMVRNGAIIQSTVSDEDSDLDID